MNAIYFPIVASTPNYKKGVGLCDAHAEDVGATNCGWYYNWTSRATADPRFVPMSWGGSIPPQKDGYLLFLNEPDNKKQANLTPSQAKDKCLAIMSASPNLKIIAGGCTAFGRGWLTEFNSYNLPIAGYHVHGYVEGVNTWKVIQDYWNWATDNLPGEIWVTEFSDIHGTESIDMALWLQNNPRISRYAIFTNRTYINSPMAYPAYWPKPSKIQLFESDGTISPLGEKYKTI